MPSPAFVAGWFAICSIVGFLIGPGSTAAFSAEPPSILWNACTTGSDAGHCNLPRGIAADRDNGHIFVADSENNRIVEFNALGQFVKAWGRGVDSGGTQPETCTEASECQAGLPGVGPGEFGFFGAQGLAVDSAGDVYVADRGLPSNARVQKFDRKGNFVLMFGGDVNKTKVDSGSASEEEENLCPFDSGDVCQGGTEGSGQGQFGEWPVLGNWIAIDGNETNTAADDRVYIGDVNRIQVFDTGGHYIEDLPEDPVGQLKDNTVQSLATDAAGNLYAILSNQDDVRKITPAGKELSSPRFEVNAPTALAVDTLGQVYVFGPTTVGGGSSTPIDPIIEFDPDGNRVSEFGKGDFSTSTGLATNFCPGSDPPGNLYATNAASGVGGSQEAFLRAYGTAPVGCFRARTLTPDPIEETSATLRGTVNPKGEAVTECFFEYGTSTSYGQIVSCEDPDAGEVGTGSLPVPVHADISGLDRGSVHHVRLVAKVGGENEPGADVEFKTLGPPVISDDHVVSVTDTEASLKALVNPEGFATTCHFEYGLDVSNGLSTPQHGVGSDRTNHAVNAELKNLLPGATYHWRLVCSNQSDSAEGVDRIFITYETPDVDPCINSGFRSGPSALLPDCRAYEMVTPVDKNGGDIARGISGAGDPGGYVQASPAGERLAYTGNSAFTDPTSAVNFNEYLASRHERGKAGEGWSSEGLHTRIAGQVSAPEIGEPLGLFREFMAFTPDLCSGWLIDHQTPPPTDDGQEGFRNPYRRDNCESGAGSFEALVPYPHYEVPSETSEDYINVSSLQGHSDDGRHAIFAARAKLNQEAAAGSGLQLYDRFCPQASSEVCSGSPDPGVLSLVSVLPDGSPGDPLPGDGEGFPEFGSSEVGSGFVNNRHNAVSDDGSRVYWTSGKLYLRLHPEQGIVVDECSENVTVACTLPVSSGPDASTAFFWAAAADGSKALYSKGGDLYEYDLQRAEDEVGEPSRLIASGVKGVAGASEDLTRVYFVSTNVLMGAGQNSEGDEAIAGQPNFYVEEDGAIEEDAFSFIGTLVAGDVGQKEPGTESGYNIIAEGPYERATRVSPSGAHIAFESRALLTDYENISADGSRAVEVFRYQIGGELTCVSCNPSGGRPNGVQEMRLPYGAPLVGTKVPAAAWIPTWEHQLNASHVLSQDGTRLFFNSFDALLPRDSNGVQDVYEWEAPGAGTCDAGDAAYFEENGGCLYLISTGKSPFESEFWEASADGSDIFFTTESSLVSQDPGSVDIYDARIEGGFPQPRFRVECEGETCHTSPPPPPFARPASSSYSGPGDPPKSKPCPKGKRKLRKDGKTRCVKKKTKHAKGGRKASSERRADR